ncbi:hypothetical protein LENED_006017 [Lentinula edodes]|uniref:BAG domain-containing protein n=1 Tax=Lentinula edodes TaxID=5353 RepID=A0A1Q3EAJ3_LENED|nr:hypothetical protein LENED_006017 [Lentinula edodes]
MHLNIKTTLTLEDPTLPISALKNYISQWSHLPPESIKLIHSGAVLKNDNAPLSSYRFRPNATIQVVGSAETIPVPPQGSAQKSETTIMTQIQEQLTLSNTTIPFDSTSNPPTSPASIHKEHARLSEMLLQSLLTLDAITVDGEWVQARQERKTAVREVQGYLDQLDAAWNSRVR